MARRLHMKFSTQACQHPWFYVYALVDPPDRTTFYVGEARVTNRSFSHLWASPGESEKQRHVDVNGYVGPLQQ
jgi:hypothetical protein